MRGSWSESLSGFYFDEHLGVGGELVHEVDEAFSGFDWFVACEAAADEVDFFHLVRREEEFLASGAAFEDIDCWVDVLLGDAAIEDLWLRFFCCSTNLTRGTLAVHERGPAARAVRAAQSVLGLLPPVADGGDLLVDGGYLNNVRAQR